MNTSKLWSALVVSCIACGSSFHSNDASTGGDGSGGGGGTEVSSGGDTSIAGTSTGGRTGTGGHGHGGSTSSAGSTSAGGVIGVGGDLSIAGSVSTGGVIGVGGDVGIAGSMGISGGPSGGAAGSSSVGGSSGSGGSGGSGATDCSTSGMLWTNYMDLVDKSALCDAAVMGQCVANSNIVSYGDCPIPVNQKSQYYSAAKNALQNWENAGCKFKLTMCLAQGSPSCQLGTDTAATCKSNPVVVQQ